MAFSNNNLMAAQSRSFHFNIGNYTAGQALLKINDSSSYIIGISHKNIYIQLEIINYAIVSIKGISNTNSNVSGIGVSIVNHCLVYNQDKGTADLSLDISASFGSFAIKPDENISSTISYETLDITANSSACKILGDFVSTTNIKDSITANSISTGTITANELKFGNWKFSINSGNSSKIDISYN